MNKTLRYFESMPSALDKKIGKQQNEQKKAEHCHASLAKKVC